MDISYSNGSINFSSCNTTVPGGVWRDFSELPWQTIYGIVVSIVAIPANLIVIVCLWRDTNSSVSGFSTYAISMAFTDLLVGLVLSPTTIIMTYWCFWPLGVATCFIWKCLDHGLTSVSMLLFLTMGYDRYRCVTAPLLYRSQFSEGRAARISVCVWIVGFLLWIPYVGLKIFLLNAETYENSCPEFHFGVNAFEIMQLAIVYYIPTLALIIMNIVLLWGLKTRAHGPVMRSSEQVSNSAQGQAHIAVIGMCPQELYGRYTNKTTRSKPILNYKIILMVTVFCLFWLPFFVLWPLKGVCGACVPDFIRKLSGLLTYGQSALNPLTVICTSRQIRSKIDLICLTSR